MKYTILMTIRNFFLSKASKEKMRKWATILNENHPDCKINWRMGDGNDQLYYEIQLKRFYMIYLNEFINTKFSRYELKLLSYGWKNPNLVNLYKKKHNMI